MKIYANYSDDGKTYKLISIFDIIDKYKQFCKINPNIKLEIEDFYKENYKGKLFSTHKYNKLKVSFVHKRSPKEICFFKYAQINDNQYAIREETISHSICKDIISEIKVLNLFIKGKLVKIYSEFSEIEYRFNANGELYIADVYIMFNKSEPMEYFYKWKGRLCFEIKHTHAVDIFKIKNCYYEGIPIFEHTISSKMTFENVTSSNELKDRKNYVTKMLSEKIYGNIISDPSSNEYINYCRCINENYTLKSEINYLINKNNDLLNYQNENKHQMQMLKDVISKTEIQNEKLSDFKTKVMSSKTIKLILKLYNIEY